MCITIAIPKGRLGNDLVKLLQSKGLGEEIDLKSRKLIFEDKKNHMNFVFLKNADVITYIENGIADIGVAGSDMIVERNTNVYVLEKLDIGNCKMSVARLKGKDLLGENTMLKVATKFPRIAKNFFNSKGQDIQLIKLNGSIELAPVLGLSDVIVDIVETGNTLLANGLEVVEDICEISGHVIANKVSYKFNRDKINAITAILKGD